MNKKVYVVYLTILLYASLNAQTIKSIRVTSIPLYMSCTFRVSCKLFDSVFPEQKHDSTLNKSGDLQEFQQLLLKSKSIKLSGIDVRGKLTINYAGRKMKVICFDEFGNFIEGSSVYENKTLLDYLVKRNDVSYN